MQTLDFAYDASGMPVTVTTDGSTYYYITNLQGDVMALLNSTGTAVAQYSYDPYGNVITATGDLAALNPLTYRGYVYDRETTLYYLQSRYYDPELGRFINADALVSTGQGVLGNNMFAYCLNNPVVLADSSGTAAHIGFSADGQIHDAPWRIGSPGGGGWSQDIHYHKQDYGTIEDKFLTVRAIKFVADRFSTLEKAANTLTGIGLLLDTCAGYCWAVSVELSVPTLGLSMATAGKVAAALGLASVPFHFTAWILNLLDEE